MLVSKCSQFSFVINAKKKKSPKVVLYSLWESAEIARSVRAHNAEDENMWQTRKTITKHETVLTAAEGSHLRAWKTSLSIFG